MSCEETQQALSSYVDDALKLPVRAAADAHLHRCPVCRARLAEMRSVVRGLATLPRVVAPADLAPAISDALMIEAAARRRVPPMPVREQFVQWLEPHLMPYAVGAFASLILFVGIFTALRPHLVALRDAEVSWQDVEERPFAPADGQDEVGRYDLTRPVLPTLNPAGSLAALTRSRANSRTGDDDMVVVTDVFSNGSASLADVVQAPRDPRMLDDFQKALRQDAAFVPASLDRRPSTMRVVFVLQKVNVQTF